MAWSAYSIYHKTHNSVLYDPFEVLGISSVIFQYGYVHFTHISFVGSQWEDHQEGLQGHVP